MAQHDLCAAQRERVIHEFGEQIIRIPSDHTIDLLAQRLDLSAKCRIIGQSVSAHDIGQ